MRAPALAAAPALAEAGAVDGSVRGAGPVAEAGFWRIGDVDQWVEVRGRDAANPLLVVLHGGPGSPETALFRAFNDALEGAYTVVHWDQRGAGRSFNRSIPPASMTTERFIADLDEIVDRCLVRFGKQQVVLLGHSWGSYLGVLYARRFAAKVAAYVGVGQVADMEASEAASYAFALETARARGHRRAIAQLTAIGPPPHTMKAVGVQRRWLMAMGGAFGPNLSLPKIIWRGVTAPGASVLDLVRLLRGSSFSLRLLWPELVAASLARDALSFEMPVFCLLGRKDHQVVAEVSAAYFEAVEAPHKTLVWFEQSGHMPPFEEPALFNQVLIEQVRPFAM